jgi:hypothetical protein
MNPAHPRLGDLTPKELQMLALEHVESIFAELRAACGTARERYRPAKLIERHPFVAAGLAAAAAFALVRYLRRKPAGAGGHGILAAAATPGLLGSLLSGVAGSAGRALPELLLSWLGREGVPD